jgi:hypothetical protein
MARYSRYALGEFRTEVPGCLLGFILICSDSFNA